MTQQNDIVKKGHVKDRYNVDRVAELERCATDPIYFIENYIKVQHPKHGRVPLILREYQKEFVKAYHEYDHVVGLAGRQLGKCVTGDTKINKDGKETEIQNLIKLSLKDRLVRRIEGWLFKLAI